MIEYKIYRESDGEPWDNFVDSTKDSTIFHSQQFLRYHIDREFPNHSLMFYKNNKQEIYPRNILPTTSNNTFFILSFLF